MTGIAAIAVTGGATWLLATSIEGVNTNMATSIGESHLAVLEEGGRRFEIATGKTLELIQHKQEEHGEQLQQQQQQQLMLQQLQQLDASVRSLKG